MSTMQPITIGVDTHTDVHVAVALDGLGGRLGTRSVSTDRKGYEELLRWAGTLGQVGRVGIEGPGSYGSGLTRWLRARGIDVVEVDRPDRGTRRREGKSDPLDAEAAARAVLAGRAVGQPKSASGAIEMIRVLRVARRSAMKARTQAVNQLYGLLVTAPDGLRDQLRSLPTTRLVSIAARFRISPITTPTHATKHALRSLARRHLALTEEIGRLDDEVARLVREVAPDLLAVAGVGVDVAASLLVACGDNPERLHSEAAFAHLCGVAPLPVSSGRTDRHRLSRAGDRDANRALHVIVIGRLRWDDATRRYAERRTLEGRTRPEIIRCLQRYVARQLVPVLVSTG